MAAKIVWRKRHELQGYFNPFNENPFTNTVTTEVQITHEQRRPSAITTKSHDGPMGFEEDPDVEGFDPYSVNVEVGNGGRRPSRPGAFNNLKNITRAAAEEEANSGAWLYARVAFLFFLAMLIIWVPSSVNRVYSLAHPHKVNFGLNYAASFVFPLQGFLNAVVYIITSQTACKQFLQTSLDVSRGRRSIPKLSLATVRARLTGNDATKSERFPSSSKIPNQDSDSTKSLANHGAQLASGYGSKGLPPTPPPQSRQQSYSGQMHLTPPIPLSQQREHGGRSPVTPQQIYEQIHRQEYEGP